MLKVEKTILPKHKAACLKYEPNIRLTWILAAAIWLKLKQNYFNMRTAKEVCNLFEV